MALSRAHSYAKAVDIAKFCYLTQPSMQNMADLHSST